MMDKTQGLDSQEVIIYCCTIASLGLKVIYIEAYDINTPRRETLLLIYMVMMETSMNLQELFRSVGDNTICCLGEPDTGDSG